MNNARSIAQRFPSPLRYPGGKSVLSDFLSEILKLNNIDGVYCEGYAGGAGAALHLLFNGKIERIILNDADIHIYSFWNSILNFPERFLDLLANCYITLDEWHIQKDIYDNPTDHNELDVGFSTFFLNRSNRGGILPNAGPTGGFNQESDYKIDARFNIENLSPRIEKIGEWSDQIDFFNLDALDFLNSVVEHQDPNNTLVYLDPPYYDQGKNLYLNHYLDEDHANLSLQIKQLITHNWIVSYDNVPPIRKLYNEVRSCSFDINYSVQSAKKGKEIIFFSDTLHLPQELKIKKHSYPISCLTR